MNETLETRETEVLERLRQSYVGRGYEFLIEPTGEDLPDFLRGKRPDAIARSPQEKIVIELKSTRSKSRDPALSFFASEVPKHAGWKFQLVILDEESGGADRDAEPSDPELREQYSKITSFVRDGDNKTALILGWSLLEALARRLSFSESSGTPKRYKPQSVIEKLISDGFVEDHESDLLRRLAVSRNRLVHGFTRVTINKEDMSVFGEILNRLVNEAVK
jgi:hypothetical protein